MKKRILFLFLLFLFFSFLFSQQRSFKVVAKSNTGETVNLYTDCYALVIGVSDYQSGWPDLPNAVRDADEIGDALSSLGFIVTRVKDPNKQELMGALDDFIFNAGQGKDNCLVIFFAGHGHTERLAYGDDMGYIVPKDAPNPDQDMSGFKQRAIDMQTVEAYARRI
nr:caspase family protein [Candidatus Aminicenantes bacterium]